MDDRSAAGSESSFSFGTWELGRAQAGANEASPAARDPRRAAPAFSIAGENHGFDPYNSTGRFDRHNAWERVRKR